MRTSTLALVRIFAAAMIGLSVGVFVLGLAAESTPKFDFANLPVADVRYVGPQEVTALRSIGLGSDSYQAIFVIFDLAFFSTFAVAASIIFARRSDNWMALLVAVALMLYCTTGSLGFLTLSESSGAWGFLLNFLNTASTASVPVLAYLFPDGRFVPRWTRWVSLLWVIWAAGSLFFSSLNPYDWPVAYTYLFFVLGLSSAVIAQIYRYRRVSDPEQRQQTKWVVFGFALVALLYSVLQVLPLVIPALLEPGTNRLLFGISDASVFFISQSVVPLCIAFSMLQYRLWDIDLIINRSFVYMLVSGLLIIVFGLADKALEGLLTPFLETYVSQFASGIGSLFIAVLAFIPVKQRTENFVNRRFFGDRLKLHRALADLAIELRPVVDMPQLSHMLLERVCKLLNVAVGGIFLRESDGRLRLVESRNLPNDEKIAQNLPEDIRMLRLLENGDSIVRAKEKTLALYVPLSLPQSFKEGESRLVGVLALGPRLGGLGYSSEERLLLLGLADQIAANIHFLEKE